MHDRRSECDIRVQLASISRRHTQVTVDENGLVMLENLSTANPTLLNGDAVGADAQPVRVKDKARSWHPRPQPRISQCGSP